MNLIPLEQAADAAGVPPVALRRQASLKPHIIRLWRGCYRIDADAFEKWLAARTLAHLEQEGKFQVEWLKSQTQALSDQERRGA